MSLACSRQHMAALPFQTCTQCMDACIAASRPSAWHGSTLLTCKTSTGHTDCSSSSKLAKHTCSDSPFAPTVHLPTHTCGWVYPTPSSPVVCCVAARWWTMVASARVQIGQELDQLERQMLEDAAGPSSNLDESGMFSIQVCVLSFEQRDGGGGIWRAGGGGAGGEGGWGWGRGLVLAQ